METINNRLGSRRYDPTHRGKYPHMFPLDIKVWERFLDLYGWMYTGFYYDVKVGRPAYTPAYWDEAYRKDAEILSKLRIDAVGEMAGEYHLIEVKPKARASAIGQILTYLHLFQAEVPLPKPVKPVLIAEEFDHNLYQVLEANDIAYFKV